MRGGEIIRILQNLRGREGGSWKFYRDKTEIFLLLLGLWYLLIFPGLRKALQESVVLPGKQGFKLQMEYFLNYISLQPTKSIPQ